MRHALIRHVWRGHVASALPVTVVSDDDERVITYLRRGTPIRWVDGDRLPDWVRRGCRTIGKAWDDTNVLAITPHGRAHTVWAMWRADDDAFLGWYVNLQEPMRATALGWDTMDQELDVTVSPRLTWRWKDEDAFAEQVELGHLTADEADAVRREGEAVIADIEARHAPFDEPWPDWRPDPSWPLPSLPEDWDRLD